VGFDPAGSDIGGVEGEAKRTVIPFSTVVDRVSLEKAGFALIPVVMGADLDIFLGVFPV
jgi:hypothetical protein